MVRCVRPLVSLALLAIMGGGCTSPSTAATGMETGACINAGCFDGLVCLSNLCVDPDWDPDGPSGDDDEDPPTGSGGSSADDDDPGSGGTDGSGEDSSDSSPTTVGTTGDPSGSDSDGPTEGETTGQSDNPLYGEVCRSDNQCGGGHCYVLGALGGICGECTDDAHCASGGCSVPNPFAEPPRPALCNQGELGGGCESDSACAPGLLCAEGLDIPGVLSLSACSQCRTDGGCPGTQLCSLNIDIGDFSGQRTCVSPGSVPHSASCDLDGSGDAACSTGLCTEVSAAGLLTLGICGECENDVECALAGGSTCQPGSIDLDTGMVVGSTCI